jgi:hypothetical protein
MRPNPYRDLPERQLPDGCIWMFALNLLTHCEARSRQRADCTPTAGLVLTGGPA